MEKKLANLFSGLESCYVEQLKEWGEIILNFETSNKYKILDEDGNIIGHVAEKSGGFFSHILRLVVRSHRSMDIQFWDKDHNELMRLRRPFYWFWSDLSVLVGRKWIGSVHRKFSFIHKLYDLKDKNGSVFCTIKSPIWRLWTFPIFNKNGTKIGKITKKWGGILKESFTDADKFKVEFPAGMDGDQKAIILATAISVDLDYFENSNQSRN